MIPDIQEEHISTIDRSIDNEIIPKIQEKVTSTIDSKYNRYETSNVSPMNYVMADIQEENISATDSNNNNEDGFQVAQEKASSVQTIADTPKNLHLFCCFWWDCFH